jgi:hypothetical protein
MQGPSPTTVPKGRRKTTSSDVRHQVQLDPRPGRTLGHDVAPPAIYDLGLLP